MSRASITVLVAIILIIPLYASGTEVDPYINRILASVNPTQNSLLLDGYPASGIGSYATPQKPILLNPAFMAAVPQTQVAFDHQRYFWGIGDPLYSSSFVYVQHFLNSGIGLSFGYFGADLMVTQSIALHYGRRLISAANPKAETNRIGFFGGATARLRRRGYLDSNFRLADPGDPLLTGDLSKTAFSGGVGFIYQGRDWRVFLTGDDVNMPNMALESGVEDRLPMQIQAGGEFPLPWWELRANPVLSYHTDYSDFAKDIDPTITLRRSFQENQFDMSVSAGRWALGMGVQYFVGERSGPGLGYEISIPTTGIGKPSHRFSATYRLSPPPPAYPDITVGEVDVEGTPVIDGEMRISAVISNDGPRKASNIPINFVVDGQSLGIVNIPKIGPKSSALAEFVWVPDSSGEFDFLVRADDEGGNFPDFEGVVLELDEMNNVGNCSTRVYSPPKPTIVGDPPGLMVTQLITVTEDEPVVPIVFFEQGKTEVPARFDTLLDIVANRLVTNSDGTVMVEGFFGHDDSVRSFSAGSLLATARAENVARHIVERYPELRERVRISLDHDPTRTRAEKEDFEGTRVGKIFTAQENRRAELRVYAKPPREWLIENHELQEKDYEILRRKLDNNDLFEVVCIAPTLDSAFATKFNVAEGLGPRYKDRVFAREAPSENCKVVITAGAILYKPRAFEIPASDLRVEPGFGTTVFTSTPGSEAPVRHTYIQVRDDRNRQLWHIEEPDGFIETSSWDWKDKDGRLATPETMYWADITVKDVYDQIGRSAPETLRVVKANRRDLSERLILVQFTFAGTYGEPDYASVRMEYLARKVVNRIAQDGSLRVVVGGHTDIVGVESGNIKLSNRRAEEQLGNLRKYMMRILSLDSKDQMNAWLESHNSVMSARGYGPSRPYIITRGKGENSRQVTIGDNNLPEGRITNRRVEIEFTPLRE